MGFYLYSLNSTQTQQNIWIIFQGCVNEVEWNSFIFCRDARRETELLSLVRYRIYKGICNFMNPHQNNKLLRSNGNRSYGLQRTPPTDMAGHSGRQWICSEVGSPTWHRIPVPGGEIFSLVLARWQEGVRDQEKRHQTMWDQVSLFRP